MRNKVNWSAITITVGISCVIALIAKAGLSGISESSVVVLGITGAVAFSKAAADLGLFKSPVAGGNTGPHNSDALADLGCDVCFRDGRVAECNDFAHSCEF